MRLPAREKYRPDVIWRGDYNRCEAQFKNAARVFRWHARFCGPESCQPSELSAASQFSKSRLDNQLIVVFKTRTPGH